MEKILKKEKPSYTCTFTHHDGCTQTLVFDTNKLELGKKRNITDLAKDWQHDLKAVSFKLSPIS